MKILLEHRWTPLYLQIMGLMALSLFLYGFFPLKYHSGKISHIDDLPNFIDSVSIDGQAVYYSGENSVVLMVIDGLRYDFVTEEYMPYTGELIKNKSACIYVAVAEPPTVTMPRIKSPERKKEKAQWRRTINFWRDIFAMMTGCVSTFADVALNFGAPAVRGDSVIRAAYARGKQTVMYGDDTWLRLFPKLWSKHDGTTSFFVTDYTEVDNNVTRHLDRTLAPGPAHRPGFDFLVLHYLGLDHIGHLEGARSPKIKPKLLEMDEVVKKIVKAMQLWNRLGVLIICGDHGMRDAGGHGGATSAEVLVPLVVIKSRDSQCEDPASKQRVLAQVDVAPSISWLLNSPVPGDSTGRIIPALMPSDVRQHLYLLHYVAKHNVKLPGVPRDKEFYRQFQRAEKQFAHYLATGQQSAAKIAKDFYEESLEEMAKFLTESNVDFDVFAMVIAIILLYLIAAALGCIILFSLQNEESRTTSIYHRHKHSKLSTLIAFFIVFTVCLTFLTISCFVTETKSQLCSFDSLWSVTFIAIPAIFAIKYFFINTSLNETTNLSPLKELNSIDYLLISCTLLHPWTFFGTSFIEEEHMTWYFIWNTLMFFVLVRTIAVIVMYLSKRLAGATEIQDKPELETMISKASLKVVPQWVLLIALHRYLRTMNQTGDRWLFLPDTADWLNAPENAFYLQCHLVIGTLLTFGICVYNLKYTNNVKYFHTIFTTAAVICILCYRVATNSLDAPFHDIKTWDHVNIVTTFWIILSIQAAFEIMSYVGSLKYCGCQSNIIKRKNFEFKKPKEKAEGAFYDPMDDSWVMEEVKFNLARSLSHLMLNDMMLIIILLMRPHNVIMVPSIIVTCRLTTKCLDHKLLDSRQSRRTDSVDILAQTLVHMWIGMLFFFYQGNSNSLASVDLGSGYVGLREYSAWRVAFRMGLHAYAGPALAGASLFCTIVASDTQWHKYLSSLWRAISILAYHRIYCLVVYCIVAIFFRHHLFVWTVFSPKLLYDFVATIFSIQAVATIGFIVILTHATSWLAKILTFKTRF